MADKIIVLSGRPATLKKLVNISFNLTDEINTPLNRRNAKGFGEYFSMIWKELELHE